MQACACAPCVCVCVASAVASFFFAFICAHPRAAALRQIPLSVALHLWFSWIAFFMNVSACLRHRAPVCSRLDVRVAVCMPLPRAVCVLVDAATSAGGCGSVDTCSVDAASLCACLGREMRACGHTSARFHACRLARGVRAPVFGIFGLIVRERVWGRGRICARGRGRICARGRGRI
eukprot:2133498-Pleurochrysis_carterae.AAC.1